MTTTNGHAPKRVSERELRETLRDKFQAAVAAGKSRTARRLLESWWLWDGFGGSDLWDRIRPRSNTDSDTELWLPPNVPSDRRHGGNWPVWRTQAELDRYRQTSRVRAETNSFAKGLLRNLTNNVIGKGYSYQCCLKGPDGKPLAEDALDDAGAGYLRKVQQCLDDFLRLNHWNCAIDPDDVTALAATREREVYRTVLIDGECFLRFHRQDDGTTLIRVIDASNVRDGSGYLVRDGWTYGIQHKMDPFEDVETPLRYAIFWPDPAATGGTEGGAAGGTWDEVDAAEVLHLKGMDTPSTVKRGLPLFVFDVGDALDRAAKLQRNVSFSAAIRAAIAETWQYEEATSAQISSMAQALAERTHTDATTGKTVYEERIRPGTIRRGPTGASKVEEGADNSQARMAAVQGDLQHACAGAGVASFVIGDVASGNYSNYESASFPPVQNAACEQEYYKLAFTRAAWKALEWAAECGVLPRDVRQRVIVQVEAPAVLHRNELEKAQEDQIGVMNGWKDRQTCAAERGYDYKQVEANNQEYQDAMSPGPGPGLTGGDDDDQGGGIHGMESLLREAGFSGIDSHGHKWVNGKQVARGGEGGGAAAPGFLGRAKQLAAKAGKGASAAAKAAGAKVKARVAGMYQRFEERYGRKGAVAIMGGMVALAPLPGSTPLVLGIAEGALALGKVFRGKAATLTHESAEGGPDTAALVKGLRAAFEELAAEVGADVSGITDDQIAKAILDTLTGE